MKYVIVVAGGKGLRMGSDLPKQFLPIGGRPLLMYTLEAFKRACPGIRQILVLPQEQQDFWKVLCRRHDFTLPHTIVAGGATRFHSVQNGLAAIPLSSPGNPISPLPPTGGAGEELLVAIHDGVRPFASEAVIRRCFDAARQYGAAVPVIPVIETLRELSPSGSAPGGSFTADRTRYRLVQTPQAFQLPLLRRAYEQPYREAFTDDASVVEALGHAITLVEGNRENIKITTPLDLTIAEALLQSAHS